MNLEMSPSRVARGTQGRGKGKVYRHQLPDEQRKARIFDGEGLPEWVQVGVSKKTVSAHLSAPTGNMDTG